MITKESLLKDFKKYFWVFFLIGFIVYFHILTNGFVWDDMPFIINNQEVHQFNLLKLFGPTLFNSGPFYRPIPAVYFAAIYSLSGDHAFLYHLTQLLLHTTATFLLFIFFRYFFRASIALFLSLIFLIHPINVESVAFVGATQSELYFIPGITALILALKKNLSLKRLFAITGFLLITSLTKETGFLFILLVIAYRSLFKLNKLKHFFISATSIISFYAILRLLIGGVGYEIVENIPITRLTLPQRILNIPAIIFYYIKTFFYPKDLAVWQNWVITSLTFNNFIIPLILSGIFFIILLWLSYFLYKKSSSLSSQPIRHNNKKQNTIEDTSFQQFIFFLFWFVIGIFLILQLVPLDMTVAERWFYFPIVGILGMIGVVLQKSRQTLERYKKISIAILLTIVCLLSFRTFIRTFDWKSNATLYGHDVKIHDDNALLLYNLANALYYDKRFDEALFYAKRSVTIQPSLGSLVSLGLTYQKKKQYSNAVSTYIQAIQYYKSMPPIDSKPPPGTVPTRDILLEQIYVSLASTYLIMNRPDDVVILLEGEGLKKFPDAPRLYYFLALAENQMGNHQKALEAIIISNELMPNKMSQDIIFRLKNNLPINLSPQ